MTDFDHSTFLLPANGYLQNKYRSCCLKQFFQELGSLVLNKAERRKEKWQGTDSDSF